MFFSQTRFMKMRPFFHLLILLFFWGNGAAAKVYFIQINHDAQAISAGEILPKNIRKFDKTWFCHSVKADQPDTLAKYFRQGFDFDDGTFQLVHIHGMWGGKERFMAENVLDFQSDFLENDSLPFQHLLFVLWDANAGNYFKNRAVGQTDAPILGAVFRALHAAFPATRFTVQTHSMGAWILANAIRTTPLPDGLFAGLFFYAPDLSEKELQGIENQLFTLFEKVFIFYHKKDLALKISTRKNGVKRIGRNPTPATAPRANWVDCTGKKCQGLPAKISKHLYYRSSRAVRKEILHRMAQIGRT
ncbi:MAG: alpha/beta hydrolase [Bacteroidetes bacterium]|nr:MAG: alpha/beta hydrolase [Bacteroidota bacterium]